MMDRGALNEALGFLDRIALLDGHNDLPYVIRCDAQANGDVATFDLPADRPGRDTDIPKLRAGKVAAQFWAAYVPPREAQPASYALQQIAIVKKMNRLHSDVFMEASCASDVKRAKQQGKIASFITVENGAALENRLDCLQAFYDLGVRLMTLCHNNSTDWCDSATDAPRHNGLSAFGREVIGAMNELGMIVDLAHVSPAVMHQVLDITRAPVVWSHSNAMALSDHPRNVPNDVLARVAGNGGVVMATFVPDFISQKSRDWSRPLTDEYGKGRGGAKSAEAIAQREREIGPWPKGTLSEYCDQVEFLARTIGHDHIGIGSDFFGGPQGKGLETAACFPAVIAELLTRGWSEANLAKLASGNFLRVFEAIEAVARKGS
jgi:membrane dipeptidase